MPTWMKALLIAGVLLLLLFVGAVVAAFFVARTYGPGLVEAGKRGAAEGQEYGRLTDNDGCVNEAAARQARAEGFGDMLKNTIFLAPCLEASRPTPGFCDDVPRPLEFMKSVTWQQQQCKRYGLSPEKQCGQLFQQVQSFCEMRRAGHESNANEANASEDESTGDVPPPPPPPAPPPGRR